MAEADDTARARSARRSAMAGVKWRKHDACMHWGSLLCLYLLRPLSPWPLLQLDCFASSLSERKQKNTHRDGATLKVTLEGQPLVSSYLASLSFFLFFPDHFRQTSPWRTNGFPHSSKDSSHQTPHASSARRSGLRSGCPTSEFTSHFPGSLYMPFAKASFSSATMLSR